MYSLNSLLKRAASLFAAIALASAAHATTIETVSMSLSASDPTQMGRPSRDGAMADWTAVKSFPGVFNPGTVYRYTQVTLDMSTLMAAYTYGGFMQVIVDSPSLNTFVMAYADSYDPTNMALNYLGDAGTSGNVFGNPQFFQFLLPEASNLVLVMVQTAVGLGLGDIANITVEAFADSDYTDLAEAAQVPVPGSLALAGLALVVLGARRARRNAAA